MSEVREEHWALLKGAKRDEEMRFVRLDDGTFLYGNGDIFDHEDILAEVLGGEIFLAGHEEKDVEMVSVRFKSSELGVEQSPEQRRERVARTLKSMAVFHEQNCNHSDCDIVVSLLKEAAELLAEGT